METTEYSNGAAPEVRLAFGPKNHQSVTLETGELMLRELFESQPQIFGKLLQLAMGIEPRKRHS